MKKFTFIMIAIATATTVCLATKTNATQQKSEEKKDTVVSIDTTFVPPIIPMVSDSKQL